MIFFRNFCNMELKEYLKIIKENRNLFFLVVLIVVSGSFTFFLAKPVSYSTSLTLNISRQGSQSTPDYKYDDFYRLQADEKFAETVAEWLKSPRTVADIYAGAGISVQGKSVSGGDPKQFTLRRLTKSLKPEKRSSQIVAVNFSAAREETAKKISDSIVAVISKNTEDLNRKQNENTWFTIIAQDAVIVKDTFDPFIVFVVSLAIGIFAAFWTIMISHYIK